VTLDQFLARTPDDHVDDSAREQAADLVAALERSQQAATNRAAPEVGRHRRSRHHRPVESLLGSISTAIDDAARELTASAGESPRDRKRPERAARALRLRVRQT
jgi:hypothetical protein